jgi:hypothetical protein
MHIKFALYWETDHLHPPRSLAGKTRSVQLLEVVNIPYREASIFSCCLHAAEARYKIRSPIECGITA